GFAELEAGVPPGLGDIVGLEANGQLHLLSQDVHGRPSYSGAVGTKGYSWHRVHPRANPKTVADQRVNSFTLGSAMELRSGALVVKQPVDRPCVYFGLGDRRRVTLLQAVWTDGASQREFDRRPDAVMRIEQRLKGSCPFLFTWDGTKMTFVADFC